MSYDVATLTQAIELMAAGSWAVDTALRRLDDGDVDQARLVLDQAGATMRDGLAGLRTVLEEAVREAYERPTRLARALESLEQLRELAPRPEAR
ncbi:MAG TPA: hypothetical protein VM618_06920 [Acidimicrobiia bacterium]|nr:hypothetical protein [Acidimicrobiia bacterium]